MDGHNWYDLILHLTWLIVYSCGGHTNEDPCAIWRVKIVFQLDRKLLGSLALCKRRVWYLCADLHGLWGIRQEQTFYRSDRIHIFDEVCGSSSASSNCTCCCMYGGSPHNGTWKQNSLHRSLRGENCDWDRRTPYWWLSVY